MASIVSLIEIAIAFGTVIMFGTVGEILTEKSGHLNLGVPGIMYIGAICSLCGGYLYESSSASPSKIIGIIVALVTGFAGGMLAGALFSFMTVTLKANQNVTGLTITILGGGLANFFGGLLSQKVGGVGQLSLAVTASGFRANLPISDKLGAFGSIFFSYGFMVYFAIVLAIVVQIFLSKSKKGLNLRAVGESPATADAAGINVTKYQYLATMIGGGISALGGVYFVMDYTKGTWSNDGTIEGLGWLAVALVIFATWKPKNTIWGAYLFGALYWLYFFIPGLTRSSQELFKMLPYIMTIIVLVVTGIRNSKESQGPAHLGLPYFREER